MDKLTKLDKKRVKSLAVPASGVKRIRSSHADVVHIKQEPQTEEKDTADTEANELALVGSTSNEANLAAPAPGTREYAVLQASKKGVISPMKAMKAIVEIPPAKAQVKLISFNIFGEDGEPDYTVGLVMTGDFFAVHDQIKAVDKHEAEVNGVCIPVVENAKRARFISEKFMKTLLNAAPEGCKDIAKYLSAHTECFWFIFAPKIGDEDPDHDGAAAAAISAAVSLGAYASIWKNALLGKPVHFDEVSHTHYYIQEQDLKFLQMMNSTPDPHFRPRNNMVRR